MKKALLEALIVTLAPTISVRANDAVLANKKVEWSINNWSATDYFGTIVGGVFYAGPMSFTDIIARMKDSFGTTRVDLSIGQKLDSLSFDKDGGNEYDLIVGRSMTFGPASFPVNVDYSVTYLALHHLKAMKDDVVSNAVRVDLPKVPFVKPYIVLTRFDFVGDVAGSGWFVYGGVERTDRVGAVNGKPVNLGLEYRAGYSGELFGTGAGLAYHRLTVSLTAELSNGWVVTPALIGQVSGHGQPAGRAFVDRSRLFASLNLSKSL